MKKNLYSLTLSDDVVREVDALAHRMGTNRSALVNQILAEYVSVPTPERRWNDIFEAIEELMTPTRELVPFFAPGSSTMSLKSSLSYQYRPPVQYVVDLRHDDAQTPGPLHLVLRTQAAAQHPIPARALQAVASSAGTTRSGPPERRSARIASSAGAAGDSPKSSGAAGSTLFVFPVYFLEFLAFQALIRYTRLVKV